MPIKESSKIVRRSVHLFVLKGVKCFILLTVKHIQNKMMVLKKLSHRIRSQSAGIFMFLIGD